MFPYFGCKGKIINLYPPPEYDLIIEPFAGSARYACKYGVFRDVWINDKYMTIANIWRWLIQVTKKEFEDLPELQVGEDLRDYKQLSQPERDFLGFCMSNGIERPDYIATGWAARDNETSRAKQRFKRLVGKISHWKVTNLNFTQVVVKQNATYFIDPPYQNRKRDYIVTNDDGFYPRLRTYANSVQGQTIVCEGRDADWLDGFIPLTKIKGQNNEFQMELIRHRHSR